ncbi:unnamed protein product [Auanema sp. JU1783]|nr:unnamed protein product [Auanema sp. JU1783]
MPPSVAVSKLPSLHQPRSLPAVTSSSVTGSKLMAPSRIALPKSIPSTREAPPSPSPQTKTSSLRPPTSSASLRSPSRGSGNNNGSVTSTTSSTIRGSLSSIDSAKSIPKPSSTVVRRPPSIETIPTRSYVKPPQEVKKAPVISSTKESKMLKLKLFGNKEKKEKTPQASPALIKKTVVTNNISPSKIATPNKPSIEMKTSRLTIPSKRQTVQLRPNPVASSILSSNNSSIENLKRTSKSSEEDSAYAGFGSTSPASSTQSSISLRSASTKDSREMVCEKSPTPPPQNDLIKTKASDAQDKPMLAVKALNVNASTSSLPTSRLAKPTSMLSLNRDKKAISTVPKNSPEEEKPVASTSNASTLPPSPTVGIVSPMQHRKNLTVVPTTRSPSPSSSDVKSEKVKPAPPIRGNSKLESGQDSDVTHIKVPAMAPVRQPPSYTQLLNEGRFQKSNSRLDSSTSEDSLDSITTTVRVQVPPTGYRSEGNTMHRRSAAKETTGYASESGIAIYEKMQDRLRECRESMAQGGLYDYGDSLEDSSSLSSGISDNFDDISTDDLSGPDHSMATATYGKPNDYQPFSRSVHSRGPRSSSTSMEHRSRRVAEQENLHQLLQQCRTSQRGIAAGITNPLRSPGYNTIGFTRNVDSDTLSVHSRASVSSSARDPTASSLSSGFHSLDRKTHMTELYENSRMWTDRNAMAALVSPRRMPPHVKHQQQNDDRLSTNASSLHTSSTMSRSMVMLDVSSSSPATPRRRTSPHASRNGRMPLSVAACPMNNGSISSRSGREGIYSTYRDPIQLHRLNDEVSRSPSHSSKDPMGSHLSLASSTAYSTMNERYEAEIRKMNNELDGYRQTVHKLTRKHDDYNHLMEVFDQRLSYLARHVEKAQLKPEELAKLRQEIENLRDMSNRVAQTADAKRTLEGAGELLRQPSLESVASMASHRSSMSSSSKSSKTDKLSLNSFGAKSKKSWTNSMDAQIRSSFTKAFSKKKNKTSENDHLNTINGSSTRLDEIEVVELKKQLEDRDEALTDVRLDALDRAREVDVLRETVNRLKNENKQLKQDMSRLLSTRSRASSQVSLAMNDEEPLYEIPPASSSSASQSSKRSSGCNSVKVTVNVDMRGVISSAICPDNEIIIGFLAIPAKYSTWQELDQQIYTLFDAYISRIDPDRLLGLHCSDSLIGYQIGNVIREKEGSLPDSHPADVISPTTTIRLFMRGAAQQSLDSLVLECLFPRSMLEQLLQFLLTHRRLVLSGATGIGKSNLARQLASYLSVRIGLPQDGVQDIKVPDDTNGKDIVEVEQQLEKLLRGDANVVVLMDNIPRHRIAFVSSVFSTAELGVNDGPFVICTVNRACQLPEMQVHHNFKLFLLTNRMDGVKGFMARFLRRRIIEAEFRLSRQTPQELIRVIQFLPIVLQAVNTFIEKANSLDVTVGPRIFLQCPLGIEESRLWFVRLWNDNIVPYMVRVAREGVKFLGRCGSFEDPTDVACEHWPWIEGPGGEEVLTRLSIKDIGQGAKQPFNPLDTLIRLQASRNSAIENI